jgi:3-oxoacid CoA-transferase A subunit
MGSFSQAGVASARKMAAAIDSLSAALLPPGAMNKVFPSALAAIEGMNDGATIAAGGFGLCGIPENLIRAIRDKGLKNLTFVSNNCGVDDFGLGILLQTRQIKKMISSYVGENKVFEKQFLDKELEVELVPQGTLAEKLRAGGSGIPAFYTPTGVGTPYADGKEVRAFGGRECLLEDAIVTEWAIVKAWKGDRLGNLVFRMTARNFNPQCAMAGKVTIAEVEELVPVGALDPDQIHLPGIYVHRIVKGERYEKRIEKATTRKRGS